MLVGFLFSISKSLQSKLGTKNHWSLTKTAPALNWLFSSKYVFGHCQQVQSGRMKSCNYLFSCYNLSFFSFLAHWLTMLSIGLVQVVRATIDVLAFFFFFSVNDQTVYKTIDIYFAEKKKSKVLFNYYSVIWLIYCLYIHINAGLLLSELMFWCTSKVLKKPVPIFFFIPSQTRELKLINSVKTVIVPNRFFFFLLEQSKTRVKSIINGSNNEDSGPRSLLDKNPCTARIRVDLLSKGNRGIILWASNCVTCRSLVSRVACPRQKLTKRRR